jgi:hypothetical protein
MKTKKARAGTQAGKELQRLSYLKPAEQSILKLRLGELLLFGDRSKKLFWPLLDIMITQYIEAKH